MTHLPVPGPIAVKSQCQRTDGKQAGSADDSEFKQAAEFRDSVGSGIKLNFKRPFKVPFLISSPFLAKRTRMFVKEV
ncbi:hypothetical protein GALMADRAFT_1207571 [Galerina marginata CBS 339.88]|uniref:Uncharacterized protein n=1 Tax=Galerina marginata (strain CBS 339.88) TaxID=685588 RepID=A0A067S5Y0_GALM3|nr:hypothetical protein GALMADRAFT_1207571 [Galerina marginata CBS 339.88]